MEHTDDDLPRLPAIRSKNAERISDHAIGSLRALTTGVLALGIVTIAGFVTYNIVCIVWRFSDLLWKAIYKNPWY